MRKLLIPLLAAFALPTADNAEEFNEKKAINVYSYKKFSIYLGNEILDVDNHNCINNFSFYC